MDRVNRGSGMRCTIVHVFAERPVAGSQLAVVRGCAHIEAAEMQAIARETNFSETTFVSMNVIRISLVPSNLRASTRKCDNSLY